MRIEDAPPPGWYPDPEGGLRLRWWEGTDWADRWRAPPSHAVTELRHETFADDTDAAQQPGQYQYQGAQQPGAMYGGINRRESQELITQVREAARSEAERAAQLLGQQARDVSREIGPLISSYTNRFIRWIRFFSVVAIILLVAWLAWQLFVQVSLFEWIGDRIDNITDNVGDESGAGALGVLVRSF